MTRPPVRRATPSSSQQVMRVWPPPMRFRTNSCLSASSSESTSSRSSTGYSPVSARKISRSANFIERAAVLAWPWEAKLRALRPFTEISMSSLCAPVRHWPEASSASRWPSWCSQTA